MRLVAYASLFSSDRSLVVRGWPRQGQMAAVRAARQWPGPAVRVTGSGSGVSGLRCQGPHGSRPGAARKSDVMSAARGAGSGQNVRGGEVGLSGAGAVSGSGGQNVPGRVACPFTRQRLSSCCVYSGVRCGGSPQIPLCKLVSTPMGCGAQEQGVRVKPAAWPWG